MDSIEYYVDQAMEIVEEKANDAGTAINTAFWKVVECIKSSPPSPEKFKEETEVEIVVKKIK